MATSSALSRFSARTVAQTGFATLFAGALAVIPAFAGDAVALIERLTRSAFPWFESYQAASVSL
jgi:hypothetical protein